MPRQRLETLSQAEFTLRLRYAIDNARTYPTTANIAAARTLARSQPIALRGAHCRYNLGGRRWEWLAGQGIWPLGEEGEVEGSFKATITPELTT